MDQYYYEEGYIDSGYHVYIGDAVVDLRPYIEDNYLDPDYYEYYGITTSLTAELSLVEGELEEASANLITAFTQSSIVVKTVDAVSTQTSQFTQTVTATRIIEFASEVTSAFSPVMTVSAIRNSFAVLDATTSISIDAQANRAANITLESIVNQSLSGDRTRDYASDINTEFTQQSTAEKTVDIVSTQSSAFTLTAQASKIQQGAALQAGIFSLSATGSRPTRNTAYSITSTPRYTGIVIDQSTTKFGSGSLRADAVSGTIAPTTNAVWNGTNFKTFRAGYTWTSSDGLTWSRETNNISESISQVKYVNGYYIVNSSTNNASTNSTTFSTTAPGGMVTEFLGGFYYYGEGNGTRLFVRRSTTINGTYSNVYDVGSRTGWWFQKFSSSTNTGSQIVFAFARQTDGAGVVVYGSGTSWNENATVNAINDFASPTIRFGDSTYVASFGNGLIRKSTNLTSWSTVTSPSQNSLRSLEYKNSNWVATDLGAIYSASTIDNLALRYTFNPNDGQAGGVSVEFGASKYLVAQTAQVIYSSNLTSWSIDDIENVENVPGYIDYSRDNNTDYNSWGTIDFWLYSYGTANSKIIEQPSNSSQRYGLLMNLGSNFTGVTCGDVNLFASSSISAGWNHVRITRSGSNISLYTNGARRATSSSYSVVNSTYPLRFFGSGLGAANIDEFLITEDVLTNPSDTSYTQPTAQYTNTANTDLLLHFNGNFEDDSDLPKTQIASAALSSEFTQVAIGDGLLRNYSADISAQSQLVGNAIATIGLDAVLSSEFALTAVGEELPEEAEATLVSEFTQTVEGAVTRTTSSDISSQSTQTADATRIQQGASAFDSIATQLTAVAKVGDFLIACDVVASQTAIATKTTDVVSTQSSAFTQTAAGIKAVEVSATAVAEVSTNISTRRLAGLTSLQSSEFAQSADVNYTADAVSAQNAQAQLSVDAAGSTVGFSAELNSNFSQNTDISRIRFGLSTQSSEFAQTVINTRSRQFDSQVASQFDQTASALRIFDSGTVEFDSIATQLSAVVKTGNALIASDVISTLNADINVTAAGVTALDAEFAQNTNAVKNAVSSGSFNSEFTQVSTAIKAVSASGDLTSEFALTADVVKATDAIVIKVGEFTQTAVAVKTASAVSNFESIAFKMSAGDRIRDVEADLVGTSTVIATPNKFVNFSANIDSAMQFTVGFKVIHIDPYLTWKIQRDDRSYNIREESRLHKIKG
jgi:hypothetical protein